MWALWCVGRWWTYSWTTWLLAHVTPYHEHGDDDALFQPLLLIQLGPLVEA